MNIYKYLNNKIIKKEIKNWKKYQYDQTVDAYMAEVIAKITNFDKKHINIWYAKRHNKKEFDIFKFEYKGKYYELFNNNLKEINEKDIFYQ